MHSEFLQSQEWLRLQEATGRETFPFIEGDFLANGMVHALPVVGQYVYVPRGPRCENAKCQMPNFKTNIDNLIGLARRKNARWVRIEPETDEILEEIKKCVSHKVVPAPHDMQPREVLKIDITRTEEELLAEMKSKTRYNIRLAEKHGVKVFETREERYITAFLNLITATSGRKGITAHPRSYYEKFFAVLPEGLCRLFVAEYEGVVVAANIVIVYGDTATYLHGGTADVHRDVMAPYLLQWEQIKSAKKEGCQHYDFGGVKTNNNQQMTENNQQQSENKSGWSGITRFKIGFSPSTAPTIFPGTYDVVLDSTAYFLYGVLRHAQKLKRII